MWRRANSETGKRIKRSTETGDPNLAMAKVVQFEQDFQAELAGVRVPQGSWRAELAPLAERWLAWQRDKGKASPQALKNKAAWIERAQALLRLKLTSDLLDVAELDRRLTVLDLPAATKRKKIQDPLKQFSRWLAGNNRHLPRDPLSCWEPIPFKRREGIWRAVSPREVADALWASDQLDGIHGRAHPLRPVFVALLVTAPRVSALVSRDVPHLLLGQRRIVFGEDVGKKRRGAGRLDGETFRDLEAYLGDREDGPLFLGPRGGRITRERLLDWWREAFGLGSLRRLWPAGEEWSLDLAHLVNRALLTRKLRVSKGGNPKLVKGGTLKARDELAQRVARLVALVKDEHAESMQGVSLHGLRTTHRTWALNADVPEPLIDAQLGHGKRGVGRRHYTDQQTVKAIRSAQAVRAALDSAEADRAVDRARA